MNINYELYKIFYQVVLYGNISKAAQAMYISQPAVSQAIQNLEDKLGGKLLIRTKKGVILTEEGRIFFQYVRKGVENFQNGENAFLNYMNLDSGSIRIGASTSITKNILMPYLESFHKRYPKVDIKITNQLTDSLISLLRNGDLDLLIVNLPLRGQKDLKIIPVCDVHDIFVANYDTYRKFNKKNTLNELTNLPFVAQKEPSNTRLYLNQYLEKEHIKLNITSEVVSHSLVSEFIKAGFGIGYVTKEFILDELKNKKLYELDVFPSPGVRSIGIVLLYPGIPNYSASKLIDIMTTKEKNKLL